MAIVRIPISKFVAYLQWCYENKCGYIMGAYGQNPRNWAPSSWWFNQYAGTQREKALYWREHAPLVMDCNGITCTSTFSIGQCSLCQERVGSRNPCAIV